MRPLTPLYRSISLAVLPFVAGTAFAQTVSEKPYLAEIQAAMDKMMAGMMAPPSGDVDRDFVTMMRPHHQGAIDMEPSRQFRKTNSLRTHCEHLLIVKIAQQAQSFEAVGRERKSATRHNEERPAAVDPKDSIAVLVLEPLERRQVRRFAVSCPS